MGILKRIGIRLGRMRLGDNVHNALAAVGVTPERVERWLGQPCNCEERRQKLNALGAWAQRLLTGRDGEEDSGRHLDTMLGDGGDYKHADVPMVGDHGGGDAVDGKVAAPRRMETSGGVTQMKRGR